MIRTGSDFSGVGAFDQALMRLNIDYKTIFACDMDKFARQTYIENYGIIQLNDPKHSNDRIYSENGISPTLNTMQVGNRQPFVKKEFRIRKLTPRECFRLMDYPDTFKMPCSNSQMYKQAGNSIVVAVLVSIINNLNL